MRSSTLKRLFPGVDPGEFALLDVLDDFHEGVMIVDAQGVVRYMNDAQAKIDDLTIHDAIGRKVTDLYRVDDGTSPTMACLKTGAVVVNLACYYRTHLGRVVNSIHNVYPLRAKGRVIGAVCTVTDYKNIEQTFMTVGKARPARSIATFGMPPPHRPTSRSNGTRYTFDTIIGEHPDLLAAVKAARMAAVSPSPIMICGETGTGKEMIAQSIHNQSPRRDRPYVAINCAAIPENLLEGVLFGTAKGAFTGAIDKAGLFETADGGTLFLDEVNAMSTNLQAKLLRVLQERRVRRVGAMRETDVDLKIVSSVNVPPHEAIARGTMRADLFYRLAVVFISLPPLRERMSDLRRLIAHFLAKTNTELDKRVTGIAMEVMERLERYAWPGNIRELAHVVEGAMNLVGRETIIAQHHLSVPFQAAGPAETGEIRQGPWATNDPESPDRSRSRAAARSDSRPLTLGEQIERSQTGLIDEALAASRGNAAAAARRLGISPQSLHYKLKRLGIDRRTYQP